MPSRQTNQRFAYYLRPWPLLFASIVLLAAGVTVAGQAARPYIGVALIGVGCMLLGGWLTLLASHGYPGVDNPVQPISEIPPEVEEPTPPGD